ncbi:MAG: hypothetical protein KJ559_01585 [Nanoarchaeota archaeon]|nr:hypothetical protein [Nanoarchaeota archaeon]
MEIVDIQGEVISDKGPKKIEDLKPRTETIEETILTDNMTFPTAIRDLNGRGYHRLTLQTRFSKSDGGCSYNSYLYDSKGEIIQFNGDTMRFFPKFEVNMRESHRNACDEIEQSYYETQTIFDNILKAHFGY